MQVLHNAKASGLCVLEDNADLITFPVIDYCNKVSLPVLVFDTNLLYSEIIDSVTWLIHSTKYHRLNEKTLDRILHGSLTPAELKLAAASINSLFESHFLVLAMPAGKLSPVAEIELNHIFDNIPQNTYICYHGVHLFILTDHSQAGLKKKSVTYREHISRIYPDARIGEGEAVQGGERLKAAVETALCAEKAALTDAAAYFKYSPRSDLCLLLSLKNQDVYMRFYNEIVYMINQNDPTSKMEYIDCLVAYVTLGGNYRTISQQLHVHENTIRYRINNLRKILGYEEDLVHFHETIAIFVTIHKILTVKGVGDWS